METSDTMVAMKPLTKAVGIPRNCLDHDTQSRSRKKAQRTLENFITNPFLKRVQIKKEGVV